MHALLQPLFDELVAFRTCCRDVRNVQRGSPIGGVVDAVRPVTIGTDGRYRQARLIEPPAMHRLFIRLLVFRMAGAARANLVIQKHRRALVLCREDGVRIRSVAFTTVQWQSSPSVVLFARLRVHALEQGEPLVIMADAASVSEFADWDQSDVGHGKVRAGRIAPVAIRTNDTFLPVDVVLQDLSTDTNNRWLVASHSADSVWQAAQRLASSGIFEPVSGTGAGWAATACS